MKYLKIYEIFNKPDLRRIGSVVLCIKDYSVYNGKNIKFKKGSYYNVVGFYGDPQGAIEKYGINEYLPVEYISLVVISGENGNKNEFEINTNKKYIKTGWGHKFFDYFEIPEFSESINKYNL